MYHRVRPKRYMSLWYVWRNPCTYLALTVTPSRNGPNKIPLDPRYLEVPSGASKTIFEPMVRLAQSVHISYINTNTISKQTERDFTWPTSPRSSIECIQNDIRACGTFSANVHLSYINTNTISKWTKWDSTWPTSPRSFIGVSKMISEPLVRLSQIMHKSYINTKTI